MAYDLEESRVQSFSERTLKYGRNVMATAVPIILIANVAAVDFVGSQLLIVKIKEGGEVWIWGMLLALLVYYAIRFFSLAVLDYLTWKRAHGHLKKSYYHSQRKLLSDIQEYNITQSGRGKLETYKKARGTWLDFFWRRIYFWIADAGVPTVLFLLAAYFGVVKVIRLLPDPDCIGL